MAVTAMTGKTIAEIATIGKTAVRSDLKNAVVTVTGWNGAGKTPLSAAGSILLAIPASVLEAATTAKDSVAGTLKRIADLPMTTAVVMAVATKTIRIQVSFEKAR